MIGRSLALRQSTLLTVNEHLKPWYIYIYIHSSKNFVVFSVFPLQTSVAETSFVVDFCLKPLYIYM